MDHFNSEPTRVLVIEDEGLVSMLIEDMLEDLGYNVGAVASHMAGALEAAGGDLFDVAIINVNLNGQPSYPIADLLRARGIPFVFATGYGSGGVDPRFAGTPVLAKPFMSEDLSTALQRVCPVAVA